jgi:formate--tetrahydrofolate ligase
VIVATLRALKFHGGAPLADLNTPDADALGRGIANLERHVDNVRRHYGLPCVVALNSFAHDTEPELELLRRRMQPLQTQVIVARHWAEGGAGAEDLARAVVELVEGARTRAAKHAAGNGSLPVAEGDGELASGVRFLYEDSATLAEKVRAVATRIYGAADVSFDARVKRDLARLERDGHGHLPVCVAKTQYSFSTDPHLKGAPSGHIVNVREVRLAAGAGFIVMICGDVLTMPGLPKVAAAERMDLDDNGLVIGLS